jgi:hypothetical protein
VLVFCPTVPVPFGSAYSPVIGEPIAGPTAALSIVKPALKAHDFEVVDVVVAQGQGK